MSMHIPKYHALVSPVWELSLNIMFVRFICVFVFSCKLVSFQYCVLCYYTDKPNVLIHFIDDGNIGFFLFDIIHNAVKTFLYV